MNDIIQSTDLPLDRLEVPMPDWGPDYLRALVQAFIEKWSEKRLDADTSVSGSK